MKKNTLAALVLFGLMTAAGTGASAQNAASSPAQFEIASIKPADPNSGAA
jgi:hypothetical protein